ncbi:MAG: hypothetical protein IPK00_14895 [Deltaproteobacteria bacterium]|nr:hypothetical protein [Deltaproteobacteria bacterium]
MSPRAIYVDIDDVLSATIERLVDLLDELHARRVDIEHVRDFDLMRPFGLDEEGIRRFMDVAHRDEVIESFAPHEGAVSVLERWKQAGHAITLVTGRPPITTHASRRWLATHRMPHDALHHLDKWGRPSWNDAGLPALRFEDLPAFGFELAVEDSLSTAVRLVEELELPVALMDRPWNREVGHLPARVRERLVRCRDWREVARAFDFD